MRKDAVAAKKDYDYREDILYIFPKERDYDSSFQTGNLIVDLDKEGKIAGLEILNASKMLGASKNFLAYSSKGRASIEVKERKIEIHLELASKIRNKEQTKEKRFGEEYTGQLKASSIECAIA